MELFQLGVSALMAVSSFICLALALLHWWAEAYDRATFFMAWAVLAKVST